MKYDYGRFTSQYNRANFLVIQKFDISLLSYPPGLARHNSQPAKWQNSAKNYERKSTQINEMIYVNKSIPVIQSSAGRLRALELNALFFFGLPYLKNQRGFFLTREFF